MAVYEYTAIDQHGKKFSGLCDGVESATVLRDDFAKMGDRLTKATCINSIPGRRRKISQGDVIAFAYKFGGMVGAGLPIVQALETLAQQSRGRELRHILKDVAENVTRGSNLRDAFEKYRLVFSGFFVGMVEAGESSGSLGETLMSCAAYMEKRADFRRKVRSAFAYPAIVGIMCVVVVTALVIFVVPVFAKLYGQMRVPLPGPTRVLIGVSTLAGDWWWVVLPGMTGVACLLMVLRRRPGFVRKWKLLRSSIPVVSRLNRLVVVCHFIRTFAMLVSAGVSLVRAMEVADEVADDVRLSDAVTQLRQSIRAGGAVSDALRQHDIFPPVIVEMAASGEKVGALSDMLNKGADFIEKDIELIMKSILTKIEPVVTVVMGIVVGLILMGVYLPMFDYMTHMK